MTLRYILINALLGSVGFALVQLISPFFQDNSPSYLAFALFLGLVVGVLSSFFKVATPVLLSGVAVGGLIYPYAFLFVFVAHTQLMLEWEDLSSWEQARIYIESSLLIILVSVLPTLIVAGLSRYQPKSVAEK